jgi:hypothetical protein
MFKVTPVSAVITVNLNYMAVIIYSVGIVPSGHGEKIEYFTYG